MAYNPGTTFDLDWIRHTSLDDGRVASRALRYTGAISSADSVEAEATGLTTAVRCLDLTSLGADDTDGHLEALCAEARAPLAGVSVSGSGPDIGVAAVCVFPPAVATAVAALGDASIPVAAACGFPGGEDPLESRIGEIGQAARSGAGEVDVVIDRQLIVGGEWASLYDQVRTIRDASAGLLLKVIVRSGTLPTSSHVVRAGLTCAMAGADFLKTSTGMDSVNATASGGIALADAIRVYHERTGYRVGVKPAGGLRTAADALAWMRLTRGELGPEWIDPGLFRLGASSLLGALRARLAAVESQ
jgi:deoxyribose-phosphate aldolase